MSQSISPVNFESLIPAGVVTIFILSVFLQHIGPFSLFHYRQSWLRAAEGIRLKAHSQNTQVILLSTELLLSVITTPDLIAQHN